MTDERQPKFTGMFLVVQDMAAAMAFYRRLGLAIPDGAETQIHVEIEAGDGVYLSFGTVQLTTGYDPGWRQPEGGTPNVLQFHVPSRQRVDDLFADLIAAGYASHLPPFDAFWGNRYAEVDDPDGNVVGLQSPTDPTKRGPPPIQVKG